MTTTFILGPGEEFVQCPYSTAHIVTNARILTHLVQCRKAYIKEHAFETQKICRYNALHHVPAPELHFHEARCGDAFAVVRHMAYHNSEEGHRNYEERSRRESDRDRDRDKDRDRDRDKDRDRDRRDHYSKDRDSHGHHRHSHSSSSSGSSSRKHSSSKSSSSRRKSESEAKPVNPKINEYGLEEEDWEAESSGYQAGYDPEVKLKTELIMYNPAGLTKSERKKFRIEVRQKAEEIKSTGAPVELPTATTFDVKPDITNLKVEVEEGRKSPLEPGEIEDDDDGDQTTQEDNKPKEASGPSTDCPTSSNGQQNSKPKSRPPYSSRYSKANSRNSRSWSWTDKVQRERATQEDDDYTDSDDFEGFDPYI